tara:strand:- start:168 stop:374 length:207 start_codon:yes stop_codon:yes gene_type:complete
MSKIKNYMMDIEEKVYDIDGLEAKVSESEHIDEVKSFVFEKLDLKTSFDKGIAEDVIKGCWNEYWSYY